MRLIIGVGRENLTEKHWIYYPGGYVVFHRIFGTGKRQSILQPSRRIWLDVRDHFVCPISPCRAMDEEPIARCAADCRRVGIIDSGARSW